MRALVFLALAASTAAAAEADADDPKATRGETVMTETRPALDEDDPKLARGEIRRRWRGITRPVPRFKLSYRNLVGAGLEGGTLDFHAGELDFYPSSGYLRFGVQTSFGFAPGKYNAWFLTAGAALGLQYPARVTPFVEGRFVAGLLGGTAEGQSAVSYIYVGGIDTGIEVYYAGRFYITAAIGWAHPVYSAVDVAWVREHPMLAPARKDFATDSFTFKIGLGL